MERRLKKALRRFTRSSFPTADFDTLSGKARARGQFAWGTSAASALAKLTGIASKTDRADGAGFEGLKA